MNKKRKKTILPLEYRVENFFKKVLFLNKNLSKNNIDNLEFESLVYKGMRQYEELINILRKKSDKKNKSVKQKENQRYTKNQKLVKNQTIYYINTNPNKYKSSNYDKYDYNGKENYNLNGNKNITKKVIFKNNSKNNFTLKDIKYKDYPKLKRNKTDDKNGHMFQYIKNKKNNDNYYKTNKIKINSDEYYKNNKIIIRKNTDDYKNNNDYNYNENEKIYDKQKFNKLDNLKKKSINNKKPKENNCVGNLGGLELNKLYEVELYEKNITDKNDIINNSKNNFDINQNKMNPKKKIYYSRNHKQNFNSNYPEYKTFDNSFEMNHYKQSSLTNFNLCSDIFKTTSEISDIKAKNRWLKPKTDINNSIISSFRITNNYKNNFEESQETTKNTWTKKIFSLIPHKNIQLTKTRYIPISNRSKNKKKEIKSKLNNNLKKEKKEFKTSLKNNEYREYINIDNDYKKKKKIAKYIYEKNNKMEINNKLVTKIKNEKKEKILEGKEKLIKNIKEKEELERKKRNKRLNKNSIGV